MRNYTNGIFMRLIAIFSVLMLLTVLLVGRLCSLAVSDGLAETAVSQRSYTLAVADERGMIYDCWLETLVGTEIHWKSAVFPTPQNMLAVLDAVGEERREAVSALLEKGSPFVLDTDGAIDAELVYSFPVAERYSSGQTAAHLIGYLDYTGAGLTGLEKGYDEVLTEMGRKIEVTGVLNALQQTIAGLEPEVRIIGDNTSGLVLTLDARLQQIVEEIGGRMLKKGAVVLMDPYTGQIRASASFPSYSPLDLSGAIADEEGAPLLNRALLSYSVGSTFKISTAAAALETLGSEYCLSRTHICLGFLDVSGQIFRCHLRSGHGELDFFDAMRESCNPWFIGLGLETGGLELLTMAEKLGFGESICLADGITASAGNLPTESDLLSPATVANFSFGQGVLTASPVQIARMLAAVVNGGKLLTPTVVLGTAENGTLTPFSRPVSRQALHPETAQQLKTILSYAVLSDDSSGGRPSFTTAGGKTATAQTGQLDENGDELEHGWFAGFFPADDPQLVAVVLAENEGFGNTTAAPVFAAIADAAAQTLGFSKNRENESPSDGGSFTVASAEEE